MRTQAMGTALRLAVLVIALLTVALPMPAANAQPTGTPGFCPTDDGVTVVVDFGDLGGGVVVRCATGSTERDGLEALQDAGFDVEGVQRYGSGMACRIEGRPAADEELSIGGRDGYREACIDTPPAAAYWSYWSADDGGEWDYSQWGLRNRAAINGGFEGWSYSLSRTTGDPPAPRIDPIRPADDSPTTQGDTGDNAQSGRNPQSSPGDPSDADAPDDDGALPPPKQREASPPPTSGTQDGVQWSGNTSAESADADDPAADVDESSSPAPMIAAAAVIAVLVALIVVTAARRRRARGY